jgi:DNA-binding MarR family transcriptional regulator
LVSDREQLRKLTHGTLRLVQEFKKAQDLRTDLDRTTFEILMTLKAREKVRPSDIAIELDFNPSSVTRRIQSLKESGQVAVSTDPTDLRASLISITPEGEEELVRFFDKSVGGLAQILKTWSEDEINNFATMLWHFTDTMKDWRLSHSSSDNVGNQLGEGISNEREE